MSENEPRAWLVLVTHRLGFPLRGSPLWLLVPLHVVLHWAGPHPSVEGRGTMGLQLHGVERGGRRGAGGGGVEGRNEPNINH